MVKAKTVSNEAGNNKSFMLKNYIALTYMRHVQ
jgi:hypothetical protein